MSGAEKGNAHPVLWALFCVLVFLVVFAVSAVIKLTADPFGGEFTVAWSDAVGTAHTDLVYGEKPANKFDLYVPAEGGKEEYGLVVYLHAGGFTSGDKSDDVEMLRWLCSKGYVAAGINYTLFSDENPDANIYTQSMEIKAAMPYVVAEAERLGYPIGGMAVSGGSAGCCLALLYAYRDAAQAPVPVKLAFGAVGPTSFYPEDWGCFGFDKDDEETRTAAALMFSVMSGRTVDPASFGTPAYDETMKDVSALLWVDEDTVPTVLAYGKYDKMQSFPASLRLDQALTDHGVPHEYIVCAHSGHGLQNDNREYLRYMRAIEDYLAAYLPA